MQPRVSISPTNHIHPIPAIQGPFSLQEQLTSAPSSDPQALVAPTSDPRPMTTPDPQTTTNPIFDLCSIPSSSTRDSLKSLPTVVDFSLGRDSSSMGSPNFDALKYIAEDSLLLASCVLIELDHDVTSVHICVLIKLGIIRCIIIDLVFFLLLNRAHLLAVAQ
ncbi:hypothetical protein M9H77_02108 [Catharanthus roseus]|uniref:Uncharacterized protein n=1 Tax=Catharanthus roseus TaxID=4058 RepID=A0ACC0C7G9_CATRO|nr:hypothetical protein M9H77_02108 [Catharanthus roseus]